MAVPASGSEFPGTVADVMVTRPKVLPPDLTVAGARAEFADEHVVMLLLAEGDRLLGALLREDVPLDAAPSEPALPLAGTSGRTVAPTECAGAVHQRLVAEGRRRLAVVDGDGALLGLVCLKRRQDGFCSDAGVAARAGGDGTPAPGGSVEPDVGPLLGGS